MERRFTSGLSASPLPRGLVVAALLVVVVWGITAARPFLAPLCIAALLAFFMAPLVGWMRRLKVPEWLAIAVSVLLIVLPVAFLGYMLVSQGQALLKDFPNIVAQLNKMLARVGDAPWAKKLNVPSSLSLTTISDRLASSAGQGVRILLSGVQTVLDAGSQTLLVFILSIAMLGSRRHLRQSAEKILARVETIEAARLVDEISTLIQHFLVARLLSVTLVAAAASGALLLFRVQYAFLLGVFTGVMTLVPVIGFIVSLAATIAVALATGHSLGTTLLLTFVYLLFNAIDANVLTPLVGRRLNINTLATFVGFLAGGVMWGMWGMLLSVPMLGILRITFSTSPSLQPWGELLADKEDRALSLRLIRPAKSLKSLIHES